jgi:Coenzyme PQQ synthesis protein D (PqqD)
MPDADRPRRAAGIETAEFSDGLMVRQPAGRLHQLNNTASIVFELCDGRRTVAEIAGTLAGAFALSDPPLGETAACVADLRRAGVLADVVTHVVGDVPDNSAPPRSDGDPFAFFAAIYCLNLEERPDRWQNAVRRFDMLGITARVERFPAISTPRNHHVGCAMSWRLMIADARERGLANFLGIEDDTIFLDSTLDVVSGAISELGEKDWDLLYLGGAAWEAPRELPGHTALRSPRSLTCTHALAVNRSAYDRLLAGIPATADGIDEWLSSYAAIDQYLSHEVNNGHYRAYVLNPRVATQLELTAEGGLDGALRDRYTIR